MANFSKYFAAGFGGEVIPIIAPGATLSPGSSVDPSQRGKIPGQYDPNMGTWAGMVQWTTRVFTKDDARKWERWPNCNIGLRSSKFPGLDIDCEHYSLTEAIRDYAFEHLGAAPVRTREGSVRILLPYRLKEGDQLGKLRMTFRAEGQETVHAVEFLCQGQQYLIEGVHPSGKKYGFEDDLGLAEAGAKSLSEIEREQIIKFWDGLRAHLSGMRCEFASSSSSSGSTENRRPIEDPSLRARDFEELAEALQAIPCEDLDYQEWMRVLRALKGACGGDEEFYEHVDEWCSRYPQNTPEIVRAKWDSIESTAIGADFVYSVARQHGFDGGYDEFEPLEIAGEPVEVLTPDAPEEDLVSVLRSYTEADVAALCVEKNKDALRFLVHGGGWRIWRGTLWVPDHGSDHGVYPIVGNRVRKFLDQERAEAKKRGDEKGYNALSSGKMLGEVRRYMATYEELWSDRKFFDADPDLINTPSGIFDLRTGNPKPHHPSFMCSLITNVDFGETDHAPMWEDYLASVTDGDKRAQMWLEMWFGYGMTGHTKEQQILFLHGISGTGKGVFDRMLRNCLGTYYATVTHSELYSKNENAHPAGLAKLAEARVAAVNEVKEGLTWDEAMINRLTGQDMISARFMRENFFDFLPRFKMMVFANNRPHLNSTQGIDRRLRMIGFNVKQDDSDKTFEERMFTQEGPAIMRRAHNALLVWYDSDLDTWVPKSVRAYTNEYLGDEDRIGQFLSEVCVIEPNVGESAGDLYKAFQQWGREHGFQYPPSQHTFTTKMRTKSKEMDGRFFYSDSGIGKRRLSGFKGVRLKTPAELDEFGDDK